MIRGADRPYFKNSIAQLEELFEKARSDELVLQALDRELGFRTTERADRLRTRVASALAAQSSETASAGGFAEAAATPNWTVSAVFVPGSLNEQLPSMETPAVTKRVRAPAIRELGSLPSFPTPQTMNEPGAILAAWTALEALSPQSYRRPEDLAGGDRRCVADLAAGSVPWGAGERSRPKRQLYYQVILGAIPMEKATEELVKAFGADEERGPRARERAGMAAVLVDRNGLLVEENGIAVSSFAWALPLALKLKLGALGAWPEIEPKIVESLDEILRRFDEDGRPLPLDLPTIEAAHRWLVAQFELPEHLVEPPSFALRIYHHYKAKTPPEAALLNSFFLGDLARAAGCISQNAVPAGLRSYLGMERPKQTFDLLSDKAALEKAVAPGMMPAVRWPSPGGHPLVLLQQAAVNLVRSELAHAEGIIAVNGPPGTGKTTLLRDIVAAGVLDRALAMAKFDDPEKAFTPSGVRHSAGESAFFHLYELAPGLKGHEILVASSNNKAVENVSRELPAVKAIGRTKGELSYFSSVSDAVHSPREADDEDVGIASDPIQTWGLIAAVLGNARNRSAFQQTFWWHDDHAFRLYLKAAKGDPVVREIIDPKSGKIVDRRTPAVVQTEKPPTLEKARSNWRKARSRLLSLKREIDAELKALEAVRQLGFQISEARHECSRKEAALTQLIAKRPDVEANRSRCHEAMQAAQSEHEQHAARFWRHQQNRPGFFARLFRTRGWIAWSGEHASLTAAMHKSAHRLEVAKLALSKAATALDGLTVEIRKAEADLTGMRRQEALLTQEIGDHRRVLGGRMVDERFFAQGHVPSNLAAPWIPDALHRKREELFIAALGVHRAFIDVAAQKVLHNLSVLMDYFIAGSPRDAAKRRLLGDLWSTLFLVVPVLSTTFASVERMLGDLPAGSIGWLLIDEAGQALPQAAVGAILRARRSIVVGDPLQIPPVVTLPERLNFEICRFFRIDAPVWAAPEASSQTVADRATRYQAAFRSDRGARRVGIPLLVHRRCQEPMFGISNRIAYDGQMVHAPGPRRPGPVGETLGLSRWFDVDGEAESKWCPAEGELVITLLKKIAASGIPDPDLFIITPFRIVAQELRRRLEREDGLVSNLGIDIREWAQDRVGTIHTVQGREADTVILVLGAPMASQHRARIWAAGTPNILNVAVSRARQNLYVIGSRGAWSGIGHAQELASMPHVRI